MATGGWYASVFECVEIEYRADEEYHRKDDNHAADNLVDEYNSAFIELSTHFVDKPSKPEPPYQCAQNNACISANHQPRPVRDNESELGKGGHEEENDKWIRESNEKSGYAIVYQCALTLTAVMHFLGGIRLETVNPKQHQQHTSRYFKGEKRAWGGDEIHDETHSIASNQGVNHIAYRRTNACDKAIPSAFVQGSLDAKHPHRPHRGRGNKTNKYSLEYNVYNIYMKR